MKGWPVFLLIVVLTLSGSGIAAASQFIADSRTFTGNPIVLSPQTSTIAVGETIELTVTALYGPFLPGWTIDSYPKGVLSPQAVTVPSNGSWSFSFKVTGLAPGVTTVGYIVTVIGGHVGLGSIGQVTVTPGPPLCVAPSIVAEPLDVVMKKGEQRSLEVVVAGTEPMSYQWYAGIESGTIDPLPGAVHSRLEIPVVAPATYLALAFVTNACGQRASRVATVIVQPCDPPIITSEPHGEAVRFGESVSLSVQTIGTGALQYAWFVGAKGDTSSSAGSGNPLVIEHVTHDASYWVRVTDGCGIVDSDAAMIAIRPDRRRAAR
jgi:hypothetical protein